VCACVVHGSRFVITEEKCLQSIYPPSLSLSHSLSLSTIIRHEGFFSLWNGLSAQLIGLTHVAVQVSQIAELQCSLSLSLSFTFFLPLPHIISLTVSSLRASKITIRSLWYILPPVFFNLSVSLHSESNFHCYCPRIKRISRETHRFPDLPCFLWLQSPLSLFFHQFFLIHFPSHLSRDRSPPLLSLILTKSFAHDCRHNLPLTPIDTTVRMPDDP
jgi:hypothetical protein